MADKIKTFLKKFKIWRSFKLRLLIIIFLMGIIPSIIMRLGILENYESRAVAVRISDVQTQLRIIANHLITYNYLQDTSSEVIGAELEQISNLYNGRVLIINGNLKVVKDTYGISEGKTIVSEEVIRCMKGKNTADYDSVNRFIEITIPIVETVSVPDDNGGEAREKEVVRGVMLTSVSTDTIVNTLDILNRQAIIMGNIMFIFIFALAICLARILVRPFERVTRAISEVKEGYTDEPISVRLSGDGTYCGRFQQPHQADEDAGRFQTGVCGKRVPRIKNANHFHQGPCGFPAGPGGRSRRTLP